MAESLFGCRAALNLAHERPERTDVDVRVLACRHVIIAVAKLFWRDGKNAKARKWHRAQSDVPERTFASPGGEGRLSTYPSPAAHAKPEGLEVRSRCVQTFGARLCGSRLVLFVNAVLGLQL